MQQGSDAAPRAHDGLPPVASGSGPERALDGAIPGRTSRPRSALLRRSGTAIPARKPNWSRPGRFRVVTTFSEVPIVDLGHVSVFVLGTNSSILRLHIGPRTEGLPSGFYSAHSWLSPRRLRQSVGWAATAGAVAVLALSPTRLPDDRGPGRGCLHSRLRRPRTHPHPARGRGVYSERRGNPPLDSLSCVVPDAFSAAHARRLPSLPRDARAASLPGPRDVRPRVSNGSPIGGVASSTRLIRRRL